MGMTVDESIRIVVDRYIDTYVVCGGENYNPAINITRQDCEAFHVAVDTMRKYQKIEQILHNGFGKGVYAVFDEIVKVVEDVSN